MQEEMEPVYMASHLKAFKKTVDEGLFKVPSWLVSALLRGRPHPHLDTD